MSILNNFFSNGMKITGLILILVVLVLYALWFLWMKNRQAVSASLDGEWQVFNIFVKGVYSPSLIKAELGRPIRINFLRQESTDCSRFVNFPDFKIRKELPENKKVTIEIKPERSGEFIFTCDMSMYQGKLIIT